MAGGRPLKFTSIEPMWQVAMGYLAEQKLANKPLTISGLAYALDICTQTLINYTEKDEFFAPIKRLKQLIEMS